MTSLGHCNHSFASDYQQTQSVSPSELPVWKSFGSVLKDFEVLTQIEDKGPVKKLVPRTSSPIVPIQKQLVFTSDVEKMTDSISYEHHNDQLPKPLDWRSGLHGKAGNFCGPVTLDSDDGLRGSSKVGQSVSAMSRLKNMFKPKRKKYKNRLLMKLSRLAPNQQHNDSKMAKEDNFETVFVNRQCRKAKNRCTNERPIVSVKPCVGFALANPVNGTNCRYLERKRELINNHKIDARDHQIHINLNPIQDRKSETLGGSKSTTTHSDKMQSYKICNGDYVKVSLAQGLAIDADCKALAATIVKCGNGNYSAASEVNGSGKVASPSDLLTDTEDDEECVKHHLDILTRQDCSSSDVAAKSSEISKARSTSKMQSTEIVERWLKYGYRIPRCLSTPNANHKRRYHRNWLHLSPGSHQRSPVFSFGSRIYSFCECKGKTWKPCRSKENLALHLKPEIQENCCCVGHLCGNLHSEPFSLRVLSPSPGNYLGTPNSERNSVGFTFEDNSQIQTAESGESKLNPSLHQFMIELLEGVEKQNDDSDWSTHFIGRAITPVKNQFKSLNDSTLMPDLKKSSDMNASIYSCDSLPHASKPSENSIHDINNGPISESISQSMLGSMTIRKSKKITFDTNVQYFSTSNNEHDQLDDKLQCEQIPTESLKPSPSSVHDKGAIENCVSTANDDKSNEICCEKLHHDILNQLEPSHLVNKVCVISQQGKSLQQHATKILIDIINAQWKTIKTLRKNLSEERQKLVEAERKLKQHQLIET